MPNVSTCKVEAILVPIIRFREITYGTKYLKTCDFVTTIQIYQPTICNNFSSLLLDVYVQLNMFRASSCQSSGAQQLQYQPLVLPLERGGSSAVGCGRAIMSSNKLEKLLHLVG
jgi:hypothetical protein